MDVAPNAYAYMFESTPVALCATDGEGRILVINPAVERLLGWAMSEHTGWLLADRLRQAIVDPAQALCWTVALGEALAQGKTTYLDLPAGFRTGFPDGHLESVSGVVVACQHSADQRGLLVVFHNGSLMDSMSAARTRFFSAISHEFGTPLSNIASAIDLLAGHLDPANPQQQKLIQIAQAELARLRRMTEQLLLASPALKPTSVPRALVTLRPVIQQVAQIFAIREGSRQVVVDVPSNLPFVWSDADTIHEILNNLVENALRYSPPGTEVTLVAEQRPADVLISVHDQGAGVAAEDREQIFEPYYRGRQGREGAAGQGLGLPIASSLVQQLGGQLWYEQQGPAGSRFCFTLPRAEAIPDEGE
jgi:signal transduction histidine kinase